MPKFISPFQDYRLALPGRTVQFSGGEAEVSENEAKQMRDKNRAGKYFGINFFDKIEAVGPKGKGE